MKKYVESFDEHSKPGFVVQQKYVDEWERRFKALPDEQYGSRRTTYAMNIIDSIKNNNMYATVKQYDSINSILDELESKASAHPEEREPETDPLWTEGAPSAPEASHQTQPAKKTYKFTLRRESIDDYWMKIIGDYDIKTREWIESFLNGLKNRKGGERVYVSYRESMILRLIKSGELNPETFSTKS